MLVKSKLDHRPTIGNAVSMTNAPYIDPGPENFEAFKALDRDHPIEMLNMIRFREKATYPDDHPLAGKELTGAEAYKNYGKESGPIFARVGGTMVWAGEPEAMVIGPAEERWHAIFVARYPDTHAFLEMIADPEYRKAVVHRQAAVETSRLIRHKPSDAGKGFA